MGRAAQPMSRYNLGQALLLWACGVAVCLLPTVLAQSCPSVGATVTSCPTALAAAQMLTDNSPFLPIASASVSGAIACSSSQVTYAVLKNWNACHYLASRMPSGMLVATIRPTSMCMCREMVGSWAYQLTLHLRDHRCADHMSAHLQVHGELIEASCMLCVCPCAAL
jgi:hypothetical protein